MLRVTARDWVRAFMVSLYCSAFWARSFHSLSNRMRGWESQERKKVVPCVCALRSKRIEDRCLIMFWQPALPLMLISWDVNSLISVFHLVMGKTHCSFCVSALLSRYSSIQQCSSAVLCWALGRPSCDKYVCKCLRFLSFEVAENRFPFCSGREWYAFHIRLWLYVFCPWR